MLLILMRMKMIGDSDSDDDDSIYDDNDNDDDSVVWLIFVYYDINHHWFILFYYRWVLQAWYSTSYKTSWSRTESIWICTIIRHCYYSDWSELDGIVDMMMIDVVKVVVVVVVVVIL